MKKILALMSLIVLTGCSVDPSKHSNLGPPQVVVSAYAAAIKGDLAGTQKFFSANVQQALKNGKTLEQIWEPRTLKGLVKAINVSNQKEAGQDTVIIEGHVVLESGLLQEIEELVVKQNGLWVIEGVNPKYSPGMPEGMDGATGAGAVESGAAENAPAESGGE